MTAIALVADREDLKPRREPYWARISKGCYLGFRKMTSDPEGGTWLARFMNEDLGKQDYKSLGDFRAYPKAGRHDLARKEAEDWFRRLGMGGTSEEVTLGKACENYLDHVRQTKGDESRAAKDLEARFKAHVYSHAKLTRTELAKLKPAHLEAWRKALQRKPTESGQRRGQMRTDASLNREMTGLRAALNHAFRDGHVTSDFAWRGKLLPVKAADKRRNDYLDLGQRKQLVEKAPLDLADFLRGLCLLPLRPGALAALKAGDFDKRLSTLRVGKDKSGGDRAISLPTTTAKFFAEICKNKLPAAPMFARADGAAWNKDTWKHVVRAAVTAAALPDSVSAYTLRHSVITDLMNSGLDPLTVGQLSGTSLVMIQRHYGHLTQKQSIKALARLTI
jgi:integrase